MKKIKLYALKTEIGIAACPKTGNPLLSNFTKQNKEKLLKLKELICESYPEYKNIKLIEMHEK